MGPMIAYQVEAHALDHRCQSCGQLATALFCTDCADPVEADLTKGA